MSRFFDIFLVLILESMLAIACLAVMIVLNEFSIIIRIALCVPLVLTAIFVALAILKGEAR